MEEVFDQRGLLTREALRELQARRDGPSYWRLSVHLGAIGVLAYLTLRASAAPLLAAALTIALAWTWATVFAPFHECTHRTAFKSRRKNAIGAWLTGILFGMAPAVYRAFHFEHHRHTQDPARDPEILGHPDVYTLWPTTRRGWLVMASGYGLILLKAVPLIRFAVSPPAQWDSIAPWIPPPAERPQIARQCRIIFGLWLAFLILAATVIDGGGWLIAAAWLAQVFESLWLAAEHTGLPLEGTILQRTRTVETSKFVSWWLWNMNFHAEHHAWPGIPWHHLPATHAEVARSLEHNFDGYINLHRRVLAAMRTGGENVQ